MLTKKEAKDLAIETWEYIRDHVDSIVDKTDLPPVYFNRIAHMEAYCPLCEIFSVDCDGCPLENCHEPDMPYPRWALGTTWQEREQAAQDIVSAIEAWEID